MMRTADMINIVAFLSFTALAWLRPLALRRRLEASAIGVSGLAVVLASQFAAVSLPPVPASTAADWLPAPIMLLVYWQAGRLAAAPNEKLQAILERFDRKVLGALLRCRKVRRRLAWLADYLELSYLLCYPLVPLGIGVLYLVDERVYVDRFWTVVLPSAYLCYAATAAGHTLPPRILASGDLFCPHTGWIRDMNLRILRHGSIQVNTFPSGHVAAAVAASLALLRPAPAAGVLFLLASASIAAGAVAGRYHYAADAIAGAALAAAVFLLAA